MRTVVFIEGGSADIEGVIPGQCARTVPQRASWVTVGCEARGERAKSPRSIRGLQAGEDRTGELRTLVDASPCRLPPMGCFSWR